MENQILFIEAENNVVKKNAEFMEKQLQAIKTYIANVVHNK